MTWSFSLFMSSLFVMITMQIWGQSTKHLQGNFTYSPRAWDLLILSGVASVCAMEMAAIVLMAATSYGLHGVHNKQDFGRQPWYSGIFSFAVCWSPLLSKA